jgi:hypothetical protein
MFKDAYTMIQKCLPCQKISGKMKRETMPLQSITVEEPFAQWGLDVIGPINPKSSKGHAYIITATDYFTKWQEVVSLRNVDSEQLILFLKENILSRFGVLEKFITDNGSIFHWVQVYNFLWRIWHHHGTIIQLLPTRKWFG